MGNISLENCTTAQLAYFLKEASDQKRISYSKPLESFLGTDDERDLFAHAALLSFGQHFEVLAESAHDGFSNIDLLIDGKYWEIKSPDGSTLRSVETAVRKCQKQFKKCNPENYEPRLILNAHYHSMDDEALFAELCRRVEQHGLIEAVFIRKKGEIIYIPGKRSPTFLLAGPPD